MESAPLLKFEKIAENYFSVSKGPYLLKFLRSPALKSHEFSCVAIYKDEEEWRTTSPMEQRDQKRLECDALSALRGYLAVVEAVP